MRIEDNRLVWSEERLEGRAGWGKRFMAIKLYDLAGAEVNRRFSPYCWRIRMALAHKAFQWKPYRGGHFEAVEPGLGPSHQRVPILENS